VFYERREDVRTFLRVHAIPGIMDFFDYSAAAVGMTYSNNHNPDGVTIDGVPDTLTAGTPTWEKVDGPQGALTQVSSFTTNFAMPTTVGYYLDDTTPPETQCTGDAFAYGSSGNRITSALPCTDPATACTNVLRGDRVMYFESPGRSAAEAQLANDRTVSPLTTLVTAWAP
jgi:hypothetical protein